MIYYFIDTIYYLWSLFCCCEGEAVVNITSVRCVSSSGAELNFWLCKLSSDIVLLILDEKLPSDFLACKHVSRL